MSKTEPEMFNAAMDQILRADPKAVKEQMDTDKQQRSEKRKAKTRPFALARASRAKDKIVPLTMRTKMQEMLTD